jgi:hypothetical protein
MKWRRIAGPAPARSGGPVAALVCGLAVLGAATPAAAQDDVEAPQATTARDISNPLPIARVRGAIDFDGVVDEPAWDAIAPLPMTMFSPTFGGSPTERTEIRITHDDQYLYVSGRMYDSDPDGIRTNTLYRDQHSGDDLLAVVIDSYNDYETAVWFTTNPAGSRTDRTVGNDAVFSGAGMPMNDDWNAHWDVVTSQSDEGWFAEMRIPFSTLGFQAVNGEVTMGLLVYRLIGRKNERLTYPAADPRWGGLAFAKPSRAQRVVLRDVARSTPIYVTPYGLAGVGRTPVLDTLQNAPGLWQSETDRTYEAGVDLRWSPTSNLALDVTVNTDFAQVEADEQQVNLTRFALFFPEKRQFFQERASTFEFTTGGSNARLFHSRRIGLVDGEMVRIWGGARAVGRAGGMDFGALTMQTATHDGRAGETMSVLRLSQQVLNAYSSVGAMMTARLGSAGEDNLAYGLDAVARPFGDEYVTLKWAQTFDEAIDEASALESGLIQARWARQRDEGLSYSGEYQRVGRDYLPRLGFQARHDYSYYGGNLEYQHFGDETSRFRSRGVSLRTGHYLRGDDGSAESREIAPQILVELKDGTEIRLGGNTRYESVLEPFEVADATVPTGDYWFHDAELRLQLSRNDRFRGEYTAKAGTFYDGSLVGFEISPAWNPSRHLELAAGYEFNRITFDDRAKPTTTTTHVGNLEIKVAVDTRLSMSTFAQYSNVDDLTAVNARFRYNFSEGTDLWLVYNEALNTRRDIADVPRLPRSAGRTLMLKYTHALIW